MELINDTKLTVGWFVNRIHPFARSATFLVKGTFDLVPDGIATPNDEQDELKGDPPDSAGNLHYPSDFAWFKPRADLCLQGSCLGMVPCCDGFRWSFPAHIRERCPE